jgi:type I restriction enzyme S subunit
MEYTAYSKYKPSNDKLGIYIPEHWSHRKLRFLLSESLTNGLFKKAEFWGRGRPIVNVSDVYIPDDVINLDLLDRVDCDDSEFEKYSALEGDFFFVRSSLALDGIGKTAMVRNVSEEAVFECHLVRGRPDKDVIDPVYLNYYLNSKYAKEYFKSVANLVTMATIDQMKLKDTIVTVPDYSEQQKIAGFLEYKTQQIDQLIEKKKSLIDRLEEKLIAEITQAVTKGLDKAAKLRPSDVDWLGDVPKNWEVKKLKFYIKKLESGVSVNAEPSPAEEDEYGVLKTSCVYGNIFRKEENKKVFLEEVDRVKCPVVKDSIIISRMNTPELVGHCGYVSEDHNNLFLPDRLWMTEFEYDFCGEVKFFWYLLSSKGIEGETSHLATGASGSMKNLTQPDYLSMKLPIPPPAEQREILQYLEKVELEVKAALEKVLKAIDCLEEYRSAIITSSVTGRIDVREIEIPKSVS